MKRQIANKIAMKTKWAINDHKNEADHVNLFETVYGFFTTSNRLVFDV